MFIHEKSTRSTRQLQNKINSLQINEHRKRDMLYYTFCAVASYMTGAD